jgi:tetratricopeptide (TPR) repeat protein
MKKAQVRWTYVKWAIALLVGFVMFYAIYLGGKALFGFQLGAKECALEDEFNAAIDLSNAQKFQESILKFRRVAAECKGTQWEYWSYSEIGGAYFILNKSKEATAAYKNVVEYGGLRDEEWEKAAAEAQTEICDIYINLKDYDKAETECAKMVLYIVEDTDILAYAKQADIDFARENYEKAIENYEKFIRQYTGDLKSEIVLAYEGLILSYYKLNNFDKAIEKYAEFENKFSGDRWFDHLNLVMSAVYDGLGDKQNTEGKYTESVESYRKSLDFGKGRRRQDLLSATSNKINLICQQIPNEQICQTN